MSDMHKTSYDNPLITRYSSTHMQKIFSPHTRFCYWRSLWIALARAQQACGFPITDAQITALTTYKDTINYEQARNYEQKLKHEVMAHIHAYKEQVGAQAGAIIHLGATSAFVLDNTDLLQMHDALNAIEIQLLRLTVLMRNLAMKHKDIACIGYTHLQNAQPTTLGKRIAMWLQSFTLDIEELEHIRTCLRLRGLKGATGTQASFKTILNNASYEQMQALEQAWRTEMNISPELLPITGQTYDRKLDTRVLSLLANIAQSAHKCTNDIRLLQSFGELEEPFAETQIGSSAMIYKRNPIRCERVASLAKFVMSLHSNAMMVASTQWLERTLDDSANKRLSIPQSFLATDAILSLMNYIMHGLNIHPQQIENRLKNALPFWASEDILLEAVKNGADRQIMHEQLRAHAMHAQQNIAQGLPNDFFERIIRDDTIPFSAHQIQQFQEPHRYTGYAQEQVVHFINKHIDPLLTNARMRNLPIDENDTEIHI